MKLSISNIAWKADKDSILYEKMQQYGYSGLEIAPTRIFPDQPYNHLKEAAKWAEAIHKEYGYCISSMQSIWYGKQEKMFGSAEERQILLEYTKNAIDFAEAVGCGNLVFGCPRNRSIPVNGDEEIAVRFFRELGEYAVMHHTVIGMEANPTIYNTNYINETPEALRLIRRVASAGFRLNLDVGTIIQNQETVDMLGDYIEYINHVHISEPELKPIQVRELHKELAKLLKGRYSGYVSIEMGTMDDLNQIDQIMEYVKEIFG